MPRPAPVSSPPSTTPCDGSPPAMADPPRCLVFGGSAALGRLVGEPWAGPDGERAIDAARSGLGGLDAFGQCAGVAVTTVLERGGSHPMISQVDERAWDDMIAVNVKSTFFAVRRVVDVLRASGGGNIVLVGSVDGVKPVPAPV